MAFIGKKAFFYWNSLTEVNSKVLAILSLLVVEPGD